MMKTIDSKRKERQTKTISKFTNISDTNTAKSIAG